MTLCPQCGATLPEDGEFCPLCGAALPAQEPGALPEGESAEPAAEGAAGPLIGPYGRRGAAEF